MTKLKKKINPFLFELLQMFQENNSCSLVIENVEEEHSGMYTLQGKKELVYLFDVEK